MTTFLGDTTVASVEPVKPFAEGSPARIQR